MSLYQTLKKTLQEKKNYNNPTTFNARLTVDTSRPKPKYEQIQVDSPTTSVTPTSDLSATIIDKEEDVFEPMDKLEIQVEKEEDKIEKLEEKRNVTKKRPPPKLKSPKPKKTIVDFINDSISGIPTKSTQLKLENSKKLREHKKKDKNQVVDSKDKMEPLEEPEQVIMSKREKKPAPIIEKRVEPEEEESYAPQIQIIDGKLVLNQQSVTIRQPTVNFEQDYERITEKEIRRFTSATYARHSRSDKWTAEETMLFFDGLKQFGSDFTLLSKLFPKRDRRQIRNKFKREEKENPMQIENCLNTRKVIDVEFFTQKSKEKEELEGQKPKKGGKKTDKFSGKVEPKEEKVEEKDEWKTLDDRQVIDEGEYVEYQYHEKDGPEPDVNEDNFEYEENEEY
jgi:hypothetical protein